jgi:hypothetical protein
MNEFVERRANPQEAGWHLKKEVNLSIIISIIGVGVACVTGYTDLKRDIALIKADAAVLHQRDSAIEISTKEAIRELQDAMLRMESKLDRLIERQK